MSKVHLMSRGNKWALRIERSNRAIRLFDDMQVAMRNSKDYLYKTDTLIVHNKDGSVRRIIPNAGVLTAH